MGAVYSFNIEQLSGFVGGGVTIITSIAPGYRWVVRDILGLGINPAPQDAALEFSVASVRFARFVCPPNGVVPLLWQRRYVIPDITPDPGPPPFIPMTVTAIGDPSSTWEFYIGGYRLSLP